MSIYADLELFIHRASSSSGWRGVVWCGGANEKNAR